jgi:hypothetical protein
LLDYFADLPTSKQLISLPPSSKPEQPLPAAMPCSCGYQDDRPGARFCPSCGTPK